MTSVFVAVGEQANGTACMYSDNNADDGSLIRATSLENESNESECPIFGMHKMREIWKVWRLLGKRLLFFIWWMKAIVRFGNIENFPSIFIWIVQFSHTQKYFCTIGMYQALSACENPLICNERSTTRMVIMLKTNEDTANLSFQFTLYFAFFSISRYIYLQNIFRAKLPKISSSRPTLLCKFLNTRSTEIVYEERLYLQW